MEGRNLDAKQYRKLQDTFMLWKIQNPKAGPTKALQALMRLYEIHNYGISSKDLALGKSIEYVQEDGKWNRVEAAVSGVFYSNPLKRGDMSECHFNRAKFKLSEDGDGKRMTYSEYIKDANFISEERLEKLEQIELSAQTTALDTGSGKSLLESAIDSGFGSASGVIRPVFMNMLLELTALKAFMAKFISVEPMDNMTFYFPMKTSTVDTHAIFSRTALPTKEGLAGTDYNIQYDRYEINGWKYLRHAELTDEINELVGKFLNVQSHYVDDLAAGMALLWDYPIIEGIFEMIVRGKWRRPEGAGPAWATTTEIPFGKASVLTTNAKGSYLFQDLSGLANDGIIYDPAVAAGDEFKYDSATPRQGSSGSDEIFEGIMSLATLQKKKHSELQFVILTEARQTERLVRDGRFQDSRLLVGSDVKFTDEQGFLGRIAIGGSSTLTDVWEAPDGLFTSQPSDLGAEPLFPILGGKYGEFWHQGVFTPFNMRVDRGMEVKNVGVGGADVLRDNETTVITTGSKGSTWPGDYHHLSILWTALDDTHV